MESQEGVIIHLCSAILSQADGKRQILAGPTGEPPYYMMVRAYFADRDSLDAAPKSPENLAASKELKSLHGKDHFDSQPDRAICSG